jgi:hypothetical protein
VSAKKDRPQIFEASPIHLVDRGRSAEKISAVHALSNTLPEEILRNSGAHERFRATLAKCIPGKNGKFLKKRGGFGAARPFS